MTYSESKELTDTEKRLQTLRTQLFGKEKNGLETINPQTIAASGHSQHELVYLKKDLMKIFSLAILALTAQILIYLQINLKILKLY